MLVVLSSSAFSGRDTMGALEGFLLEEVLSEKKSKKSYDLINNVTVGDHAVS